MTLDNISTLKAEAAQKEIQTSIENLVKTQAHLLFLEKQLAVLATKKTLSEDEEKKQTEHQATINRLKVAANDSETYISVLTALIDTYTKKESVVL